MGVEPEDQVEGDWKLEVQGGGNVMGQGERRKLQLEPWGFK